ncbi:MAG: fatty acid desaturase [Cyanophyceae cyanobacterium]
MTASAFRFPQTATAQKLKLSDILKTLPRECFEKNALKAWSSVLLSLVTAAVGYVAIYFSPWYLLPLAWIWTGTALTGWFVIGHDCGHRSFSKSRWVNDLVGHLAFLPLIYPFHAWRHGHDVHHAHTNKMGKDNAWRPFTVEEFESCDPATRNGYRAIRGWFWWVGSIAHWAIMHFDWRRFEGQQRLDVRFSSLFSIITGSALIGALAYFTGPLGVVSYWLMPWMVYHFWMSTFTIVHHTATHIPFSEPEDWNQALAQLSGSVHCDYPRWVEILCHDINVHVPHHLSVGIPSYNLRLAHASLRENWGDYLCEREFGLPLMREIATYCHLYDAETNYQSFERYEASRVAGQGRDSEPNS